MTANEQEACPLFRLPPELRIEIYKYALSEAQPKQKTTTRLPVKSPIEVIDLDNVLTLRPSNKLLETCRMIHAEARGNFVAAQRAFWASNNFQITLKKDWGSATGDCTKPRTIITHILPMQLNMIPRVVISVTESHSMGEFHLVRMIDSTYESVK
jgi:hypothetical protein